MTNFKKLYGKLMSDSLYKNSIYLMLSTGIMSVFGFIAWTIVSKLYTAEQVGLATTIISVMGLITSFGLLGLGSGLIRFLPTSERKNDKINTIFTLASLITIIVTVIFLLGLKGFSPSLLIIKKNIFYSLIFIIFMVFSTLSSLIDSVFLAYRSAKYILLKNSIFSVLKLVFPFFLVFLGAYGIFGSWMLSIIIGFIIVFLILIYKFNYRPKFVFYDSIIGRMGKYSFGIYLSGFIGALPVLLLPLMITNLHNAEFTAYYYMAMMIANVLFVIPQATTSSLFAEGSYNQKKLKEQTKKAIKIISWLLIPAIIITILTGKYVLLFFGHAYSEQGFRLLQILAISGIFVAFNAIYSSIFQVKKRIKKLIWTNLIGTAILIPLFYLLIKNNFSLTNIGLAWTTEQILTIIIFTIMMRYKK